MKKLLIAAILAVSATCHQQEVIKAESSVQEINARVVGDQLPVDGCGAHLLLDLANASASSSTYMRLPTEATRALMENTIKAEIAKQPTGTLWMGSKNVTIRYRETEQNATLTCGWGKKEEVRVIELLDIKAR